MPKYVIHIGPPKAGSKYLQSSLASLRQRLARAKIFYPPTLMTEARRAAHSALDPLLRAGGPNAALEQAFATMNAADHEVIVLSWEGAYTLPVQALEYLRSLTGPQNEVAVVFYLRRFSERLPSLWKQEIKAGRTVTLPEAVVRATRHPMEGVEYNATLSWDRWANVFGRDSLNLVSLDNLREHKVDLFDHFALTFLNWKGTARPNRPKIHESPDAVDTEMTRALNAIHRGRAGAESGNIFVAYQRLKPELDLGPIMPAMEHDTATIRIDDKAAVFQPVYQALMTYKDRLASPEYGTEMFTRGVAEVSYVRQDYLLQPGVMPAMQAIYRTVRAALGSAPHAAAEAEADVEEAEAEAAPVAPPAGKGAAEGPAGRPGKQGGGARPAATGGPGPGVRAAGAAGPRPAGPAAKGPAPKGPAEKAPAGKAPAAGGPRPAGASAAAKPPGGPAVGAPKAPRPKQTTSA
jgi:hypothetical protein